VITLDGSINRGSGTSTKASIKLAVVRNEVLVSSLPRGRNE
jgi:hypothetical protein